MHCILLVVFYYQIIVCKASVQSALQCTDSKIKHEQNIIGGRIERLWYHQLR